MANLTVRNLAESVKQKLELRAELNGRSMEAEAREVLTESVRSAPEKSQSQEGLGTAIHRLFGPLGGVELPNPRRKSHRSPPAFKK